VLAVKPKAALEPKKKLLLGINSEHKINISIKLVKLAVYLSQLSEG
jgi:hypothetical protein